MKFPRKSSRISSRFRPVNQLRNFQFRSAEFTSVAIISLFLVFNITGLFFGSVTTPGANAANRVERIPGDIPVSGDCDLDWIIFRTGKKEGIDPRFLHAIIRQESRYDPRAVSHAGAQGLMQMMPATAKRFGLKKPFDRTANVAAGTKYLKWLLNRFDGDVTLALAGYNAGEGAVDKYKGVPPYSETRNYVKKIVSNYGRTYHPVLPPDPRRAFHLLAFGSATTSNGL